MKRSEEIKKQISKLEKELETLKKTDTPACRLADTIHRCLCHDNHTDGCGYEYETWDTIGGIKQEYLTRAKALLNYLDFGDAAETTAETVVKIITGRNNGSA